ncbi:microfibril-associated glycoprotein 4-like [Trematomus bernacchii]|uniref:microfibril-associated glycoprotein 4-like n=1 Tax=Trematomus bernacchii TaxID=40690 RepID=UPI00146D19EB|nr:microfibril-associated glycoprotein 4-like [Trematomus bernacchii]
MNKTGRQSGHTAGRSPSDHCSRNMTMKLVSIVLVLLALLLDSGMSLVLPMDCSDIYNNDNTRPSGVYTTILPHRIHLAYCDMDSLDGRWTVFQRRMDGSVNFYRPWDHYKTGFGNAAGEYWLGLETLSYLTLRKKYELLVDMEDFEGVKVFARYSSFSVDPESFGFTLHVSGFTDGGAGEEQQEVLDVFLMFRRRSHT